MTTIYVTQPQTELKIQSRQLQVFYQQKFCFAVPLQRVNQVIILGQQAWTRKAANLALSLHIPVLYFEPDGRCVEYLNAAADQPAQYLKYQMVRSQHPEFARTTAESLVRAKLHNARVLLLQLSPAPRHRTVQQVLNILQRLIDDLPMAASLAAIQSYESSGSAFYHAALLKLLPTAFRRQTLEVNPVQRLIHLGIVLLSQRVQTILQQSGLDLEIANLYPDSQIRPPLVCDFLAEFQVSIVDALVMDLLTTHQVLPEDFVGFEQGVFLHPAALEVFIQSWDEKLSTLVQHLYVGETTYACCLEVQAQAYIACLLDEQDFYRPMLLKL